VRGRVRFGVRARVKLTLALALTVSRARLED
jgi:hypothetical protein